MHLFWSPWSSGSPVANWCVGCLLHSFTIALHSNYCSQLLLTTPHYCLLVVTTIAIRQNPKCKQEHCSHFRTQISSLCVASIAASNRPRESNCGEDINHDWVQHQSPNQLPQSGRFGISQPIGNYFLLCGLQARCALPWPPCSFSAFVSGLNPRDKSPSSINLKLSSSWFSVARKH